MKHHAMFYKTLESGEIRCYLCPHRCLIADGERGFCNVRTNEHGTLYTEAYGEIIAQAVDGIEKKPLYHFLPGSLCYSVGARGCNLRCGFCRDWPHSQSPEKTNERVAGIQSSPEQLVSDAQRSGCASIAFSYSEPSTSLEYVIDTAKHAQQYGIRNVMVTNGYISADAIKAASPFIDACNVDLKAFRDDFYRVNCHGRLYPVLHAIETMKKVGIWVEITTTIIPNGNDSRDELTQIASFIAEIDPRMPWHVSRYHSDYRMMDIQSTPISRLNLAVEIGKDAGLHYVYREHVDNPEATHCPSCGTPVISRNGIAVDTENLQGSSCGRCGWEVPGVWVDQSVAQVAH